MMLWSRLNCNFHTYALLSVLDLSLFLLNELWIATLLKSGKVQLWLLWNERFLLLLFGLNNTLCFICRLCRLLLISWWSTASYSLYGQYWLKSLLLQSWLVRFIFCRWLLDRLVLLLLWMLKGLYQLDMFATWGWRRFCNYSVKGRRLFFFDARVQVYELSLFLLLDGCCLVMNFNCCYRVRALFGFLIQIRSPLYTSKDFISSFRERYTLCLRYFPLSSVSHFNNRVQLWFGNIWKSFW